MKQDGHFFKGLLWALAISIPLWIALFWLVKLILYFLNK